MLAVNIILHEKLLLEDNRLLCVSLHTSEHCDEFCVVLPFLISEGFKHKIFSQLFYVQDQETNVTQFGSL
jgi:hypothetical protein